MRRRLFDISTAVVLVLIVIVFLGACGQKGPLYLPEERKENENKESESQSFLGVAPIAL